MYLSERKRAQIRKCIENCQIDSQIGSQIDSGKDKSKHHKGLHDTPGIRKVSQILFDARDGREVFTPF